jgi:23S rRNA (pseudouridine1915-N3)-methyltransferase
MLNPARIRILAVGRVRRGWIREGLELYSRRLPGLSIVEIRDSTPAREAAAITAELRSDEQLVALAEEGGELASLAFADRLSQGGSTRLAFAIGGADGLAAELKARASWTLSLSPMTFPHELARLLLVEQLYRAQAILQGSPYHRA